MIENKKSTYKPKGVSNSSLSWFEISPKYFKECIEGNIERLEKDYFELGTKLHMFLLQPEEFNNNYVYLEYDTPRGDKQKNFCNDYISLKEKAKKKDEDAAIRAFQKNYVTKGKSEDKVKEEALELYTSLKKYLIYLEKAKEFKDILNYTTVKYLEEAKRQVTNHKLANELVYTKIDNVVDDIEEHNEFELIWQHPIMKDVKSSSTLDRLVIDHNKKIIKLIDLKTTARLSSFVESFEKYKYYRQLAYYWMAIEYYFKEELKDKNINDYKRETYIVALQTNNNTNTSNMLTECKVFNVDDEWLNRGKIEIEDLLTTLVWHYDNNLWDHTKEYYEGNGSTKL